MKKLVCLLCGKPWTGNGAPSICQECQKPSTAIVVEEVKE